MPDYDCKCTERREVKVMDYDPTTGSCTICYGKVDLTPDTDMPEFLSPTGDTKSRIIDDYKLPVHHKKDCALYAGTPQFCPLCKEEADANNEAYRKGIIR